jgi:hypothetical protein
VKTLDDIGATIERQLDNVEWRFGQHPLGSLALGALLGIGAIAGGLATFIIVLVVLVRFFS